MVLKFDKKGDLTKRSKVDYTYSILKNNPRQVSSLKRAVRTKGHKGLHGIEKIYWKKGFKRLRKVTK